jgi:hypothetical protein
MFAGFSGGKRAFQVSHPTLAVFEASKTPDFIGSKPPPADDRPWRIVAGAKLSPSAFHCATVGAVEAIEAINRTNARHWREYNAKAEEGCLIKRHDPPVVSVPRQRTPANNRTGSYTRSPSDGRLCVKTDSWGKGPAAE